MVTSGKVPLLLQKSKIDNPKNLAKVDLGILCGALLFNPTRESVIDFG